MKLAILYDWIDKWGGAERILAEVFDKYPEADIYTLYVDYSHAKWARKYRARIKATFLQPLSRLFPKAWLTPLMPFAVESLDLSEYDVVLSLSSSFMKGVLTRPETKHICYLFAPTRYLWHEAGAYWSANSILKPLVNFLRSWDKVAATRPDYLFTLSRYDQQLISKYYGRDATVLSPPFSLRYWQNLKIKTPKRAPQPKSFYLFVGRLEPYKKVNLLVEAFNHLSKEQLVIVGTGSESDSLKEEANDNILFLENLTDVELAWYYQNTKALLMPQREDFGYTALESLVFSTPVFTYEKSGTAELIRSSVTGEYIPQQTVAAIVAALAKYHTKSYNFRNLDWQQFERKQFLAKLQAIISSKNK